MSLGELIERGRSLFNTRVGAPAYKIWADDVRAAVTPYGDSMRKIAEDALSVSAVVMGQHNTYDEQIRETLELLEELKARHPEDTRARDAVINQKQEEARSTLAAKFGSITVNGDASFGDNSPIMKVTVGEVVAGLIKEIEALPETQNRDDMLESIKGVLANPTFAAVAGTGLGEILRKLVEV